MTPHGWIRATVGDAGEYINGLAFKPTDWGPEGRPIIRIQNLTDPTRPFNRTTRVVAPQYVVRSGDILVSWSATLDAFVWRGPEAVLNQHIFRVVPRRDVVSDAFLYYQLKHVIEEMWRSEHTHGSTMRHINRGPFLAHPFWLPPAAAQKAIVDVLDAQFTRLDAAVASLTRAKANVANARASVLKAAVEGRLVPTEHELAEAQGRPYENGRRLLERMLLSREGASHARGSPGRYRSPIAPAGAEVPPLPSGWTYCRIDTAGEVRLGRQRAPQYHDGPGMRPYLRVANVFEARIDLDDVMEMSFSPEEYETYRLLPGDILLNEGQSPHMVGRPAMWHGEREGMCFTNSLIRFRAVPGVNPDYALVVFRAQLSARRYMRLVTITTNIAHLSAGRFAAVEFPLPPEAEQVRIAAEVGRRMSVLDGIERTLDDATNRCTVMRQAILSWAFEGKLVSSQRPAASLTRRDSEVERTR